MIRRLMFAAGLASVVLSSLSGCASVGDKTAYGTAGGAALGAGLGAIIGSATGHTGPGIAIGAGAGALTGALVGNAMDSQDERLDEHQQRIDSTQTQLDENRRLIEALRRRGADVRDTNRGVVVNLPDVLFEFNRADLTPDARRTVQDISDVLRDFPDRRLSIEGHTDSIGSMGYNQRLSEDRAASVAAELGHSGVNRSRLRSRGFGESRPIATNNSDVGRSRNRRVEVIIENN